MLAVPTTPPRINRRHTNPGPAARFREDAHQGPITTGKAPAKRNAEVMAVEQVMRWRSEVSRFAPDRLAEFDELIADALNNPAPVQKADQ